MSPSKQHCLTDEDEGRWYVNLWAWLEQPPKSGTRHFEAILAQLDRPSMDNAAAYFSCESLSQESPPLILVTLTNPMLKAFS